MCVPNTNTCSDPTINDIEACCTLEPPPTQANACDGTESQENPATCDPTGTTIEYKLTVRSMGVCANDPAMNACTSDADCVNAGDETCSGDGESDVILNLGAPVDGAACLSGGLGSIPISVRGAAGTFANTQVAMTIGPDGFSDGLLGATADTATAIAGAISPDAAMLVSLTFDIDDTLTQDTSVACDALSLSLLIGGVTQVSAP